MKMLAVYNGTNKKFRHDGDEFQREAQAWAKAQYSEGVVHSADVRDGRIRAEIRDMKPLTPGVNGLDVLAIFDHGTPKGLPRMRESYKCVKGFAETIAGVTDKITIILYACSCGRGWWWWKPKNKRDIEVSADRYSPRDGYAVALACELTKLGVDARVLAHLTAGHTTRNPHVADVIQRIDEHGHPDGIVKRGRYAQPGTAWWRAWVKRMRGDYRFTFWR